MQLRKRVAALEGGAGIGSARIVWRETWQTDAEALDAYGRGRIGTNDNVILVSWDGGSDAAA